MNFDFVYDCDGSMMIDYYFDEEGDFIFYMNDLVWYVLFLVVSVVIDFYLSFWFCGQIGVWEKKKKRNIEFIDFKVVCFFQE